MVDSHHFTVIRFETHEIRAHFPYHVDFIVHVECMNKTIKRAVVDKGVAASVMSLTYWKGLKSPSFSKSETMFTTFDGCSFQPHCILPSLQVQLGGKNVSIKVEVVDVPLDYNLLLGCN